MSVFPRTAAGIWPKVASVVALAGLLWATWFDWNWIWGVFFLYWSVYGIVHRQAFVVSIVYRDENPILFWIISIAWLVLSAISILYDLYPDSYWWSDSFSLGASGT